MISMSRRLLLGLAALFSTYHVILGIYSIQVPPTPAPPSQIPNIVAMVIYVIATAFSLWPTSAVRMSSWMAIVNVVVCLALPLLVTSQLDGTTGNLGYSTWYVAAVGTLMVITAARRRQAWAWIGVGSLVVQTLIWAGPGALGAIGVVGSAVWVGVAHALSRALAKAGRDARQFATAEREATEWQAEQEAHLYERQHRLEQTYRMAAPMLRHISATGGLLTPEERQECRYLEAALRDEIRGRQLLNSSVRSQIMAARRRGTTVTLLDEGGVDSLSERSLKRVLAELADAIETSDTRTLVIRTAAAGSAVAVTVVGVSSGDDGRATALGLDSGEDRVDLWLEIPRDRGYTGSVPTAALTPSIPTSRTDA